ncbi:MAG: cytochrome c [Planctomycetales bacterium]|nr:cytochrome c [Planctomycetales bacterium]
MSSRIGWIIFLVGLIEVSVAASAVLGGDAATGYRLITEKPYLPPDFDQEIFDRLWETWDDPQREEAQRADIATRRRLTMRQYGLTPRPNDHLARPLQYVVTADGQYSMNCFACHGGEVNGATYPGAPNSRYALEQLTRDVRLTKLKLGKPLSHMDLGSLFMPLGSTRGTTNAVMFGVALLANRDVDLQLLPRRLPPPMTHHDMDAPPWWHVQRKQKLYIDGFAPQGHRPLMQFMLVEQNSAEDFQSWEEDFEHVEAYIRSLQPPAYPGAVDTKLADEGQHVFNRSCAECHGTYGAEPSYPERRVDWSEIRTDRVRLDALTTVDRQRYAESWFAVGHADEVECAPSGYVAPPLDGIWASAPYLHNGSVPTLWHLLHPTERPPLWRRLPGSDDARVGCRFEAYEQVPDKVSRRERYEFFDTSQFGKSAAGHDFVDRLSEIEKRQVLEYLKTL